MGVFGSSCYQLQKTNLMVAHSVLGRIGTVNEVKALQTGATLSFQFSSAGKQHTVAASFNGKTDKSLPTL